MATMLLGTVAAPSHASLIDLGNDTVLSTEQGIVWARDGNLAFTLGFAIVDTIAQNAGSMPFAEAVSFVDALTLGGSSDWRLPSQEEMNFLHDIELALPLDFQQMAPGSVTDVADSSPFVSIARGHYWAIDPGIIYNFREDTLNSNASLDGNNFHVWPVSDFVPVPEPSTALLLYFGLMLLVAREKRQELI